MKDARPRIAFIIQRYGEQMTGGGGKPLPANRREARQTLRRGSPHHLRNGSPELEKHAAGRPANVKWGDPSPVPLGGERKLLEFHKIYDRIFLTQLSAEEEYEMIRLQGPDTPDLIEYVRAHKRDYDAFIVFTYLYYTAVHTLPILQSKAIFVPTAHDETALYAHILDELFRQTPHILFNSEEEQFLLQRRFNLPSSVGCIAGLGIDEPVPGEPDPAWEKLRRKLENRLALSFVGRVENGKGCDELVDFFLRFVKEEALGGPHAAAAGPPDASAGAPPADTVAGVRFRIREVPGAGNDRHRPAPSPLESLCMAALETWMHARPMLVNGRSPVLAGHCVRSNGGLWYTNYGEFREALKALLADRTLRTTLGAQGRAYVQSRYRWEAVERVYVETIERVMAEAAGAAG